MSDVLWLGVLLWLRNRCCAVTLVAENDGKSASEAHSNESASTQMKVRNSAKEKIVICRDNDYSRIMTFEIANV